ncbi:MAG: HlyD family efflux transporter periplasmic adaptor subunit [Bacillota bacterium]|nr:MAG: hypothetical protein DIU70_01435 [Bacillota bacterium]
MAGPPAPAGRRPRVPALDLPPARALALFPTRVRSPFPARALALLPALALAGCAFLPAEVEEPPPTLPPPPVRTERAVYTVRRGDIAEVVRLPARLAPARVRELYFEQSGRVRAVRVRAGDRVEAGQVLAELYTDEVEYGLAQARIRYEKAAVALEEARRQQQEGQRQEAGSADLARLEAAVHEAWARLQAARQRLAQEPTEAAGLEVEAAEARYREAVAALAEAQEQEDRPVPSLRTLVLDLESARLEVERWEKALAQSRLVAPFPGQVTRVAVRPGDAVEAFSPVVTLVDPTELVIEADVTSSDLARLAVGQRAILSFGDLPEVSGTVVELPDPGAQAAGAGAQPLRIRVAPDQPLPRAAMGMVGQVRVVLQEKHGVLLVPNAALRQYGDRTYVLLAEPRREVDVVVGIRGETESEILAGLEEGDRVIGR